MNSSSNRFYLYNNFIIVALLAAISFLPLITFAQSYNNEWINHDLPYYKIKVAADGRYRIPYELLASNGLPLEAQNFALFRMGEEVPLYITTTGSLGSGDYIEFVGKKNDGAFDTQLYKFSSWQPSKLNSLFTDTMVYFLVSDPQAENLRYETVQNDLSNLPQEQLYHQYTASKSFVQIFNQGEPTSGFTDVNSYFADFEKGEGFVGSLFPNSDGSILSTNFIMNTPSLYTANPLDSATVKVRVLGRSNDIELFDDHHVQVKIGNTVFVDDIFEAYSIRDYEFKIPISLMGTTTTVNVGVVDDLELQTGFIERNSISEISITYPRSYDYSTSNQGNISFDDPADKFFTIHPLTTSATITFYDMEERKRMVVDVSNNTSLPIHLPSLNLSSLPRTIDFYTASDLFLVNQLEERIFTNYNDPSKAGNYTIIYHPTLRTGAIDQVMRYKDYRTSIAGGSYVVNLADINELYDQFGYGIKQSPIGIQAFFNYLIDIANDQNFPVKPDLAILLGKSISYNYTFNNPLYFNQNLIPTFGHRGSDNMLTARNGLTYYPQLAIGRISASSPDEIRKYLDKVIDYENWQRPDLPCTKQDRLWMKNIVHLGGGNNSSEAEDFTNYLNNYKLIAEDSLMGAKVLATYVKATEDIIPAPDELTQAINNGLSVVTFIGHSNAQIWSYDLQSPEIYANDTKYPFFMSNSCFVGNIHYTDSNVMALNFVLAEDKGAIAFLATVGFGFPYFLNLFCNELYNNFAKEMYGQPLGRCIKQSIQNIYSVTDSGIKITCQEFTLEADPAIKINYFEKPEYYLGSEDISFSPSVPTNEEEDFVIKMKVYNLGRTSQEPLKASLYLQHENGIDQLIQTQDYPAIHYMDSIEMHVNLALLDLSGSAQWKIIIDPDNNINETCEDNNNAVKSLFISPTEPQPLEPCNYSIVNSGSPVKLIAGTANPLEPMRNYVLQIDSSYLFNSPLKLETTIAQSGGIIEWIPNINYSHDQEYYWRVARLDNNNLPVKWNGFSFLFNANVSSGWNQSEYGQYLDTELEGLILQDNYTQSFLFENGNEGKMTSTLIGPAQQWSEVLWNWSATGNPNQDNVVVDVYGVQQNGAIDLLYENQTSQNVNIQSIDATLYPFLRLEARLTDPINSSPPQLNYWRVLYSKAPEFVYNAKESFSFHSDTLMSGETGQLSVQYQTINSQDYNAELSNQIVVLDSNDNVVAEYQNTNADWSPNSIYNLTQEISTLGLEGNYTLISKLNYNSAVLEKYAFNNFLSYPFYVQADNINPLIDISIDGRHILNGDLVSAKPEIQISVRDENRFLMLDDTTKVFLYIKDPAEGSVFKPIYFSDPKINYVIPSDETNNVLNIKYNPILSADGIYQLKVNASDKSDNLSSNNDYVLSFLVKNEMTASKLLNYPNPFTTSTRFMFTLSGSELPEQFSIQIINATGRVVREFSKAELGDIHIGQNLTEYAWDGKDQYGNELANGVYFYKTIIKHNGQEVKKYSEELDDYFSGSGWGKMYKMR